MTLHVHLNSLHRLSSSDTLNTFGFWIFTRTDLIHPNPPKKVFLGPTLWKLLKNEERKDKNEANLVADVRRGEKTFPISYYTLIMFFSSLKKISILGPIERQKSGNDGGTWTNF